jgi:peptidoglycan/LPS O-acetylase OafA/YrhL
MNKRLRELDFLRGIAILLVICRHNIISNYLYNAGWAGVDLFFVLSGFLVSGLLFREYKNYGTINVKRFLIRRGFKIYPIYYLFLPIFVIAYHKYNFWGIFFDAIFLQNYTHIDGTWGYVNGPGWSLAVEEHFYFGFSFFLWAGLKYNRIRLNENFIKIIINCLIAIFFIRLLSNVLYTDWLRNFTMTHLRIDSLLAGVLISYLYYFRRSYLEENFKKYKLVLSIICLIGLSWLPFIQPLPSFFVRTFGFTILYISFGILLINFLVTENINHKLNRIFTRAIVDVVSKIGYWSYSIYIVHMLVIDRVTGLIWKRNISINLYLKFSIVLMLCIIAGALMTNYIEKYFLSLREKYFPNRAAI